MSVRILIGDVREKLRELPEESVHCVVTSPPYWGLRCYGVDGQIGQEPTLQGHVDVMVEVFREVRRVLRKDGTVWLNYGDCYATGAGKVGDHPGGGAQGERWKGPTTQPNRMPQIGLKPKDLCMMPARVALALQADGWWIRSEIIWVKPNPMPESITDRPTSSHEKIYLLARSARYYFDAEAVREKSDWGRVNNPDWQHQRAETNARKGMGNRNAKDGAFTEWQPEHGRNSRNVWTIATAPFPGAHFATFPPKLIEPCIKAGTSEKGCCPECGAPWVREVEKQENIHPGSSHTHLADLSRGNAQTRADGTPAGTIMRERYQAGHAPKTTGWSPSCDCNALPSKPCTVLDIFGGAGTTGLVADRLKRNAILIELNPDYAARARERLDHDGGMFAEVSTA